MPGKKTNLDRNLPTRTTARKINKIIDRNLPTRTAARKINKTIDRNLPTRTVARKQNKKPREKPSNENSCQERKQT